MKILCLLGILANIFLFLWEYRSGAFINNKQITEPDKLVGIEPIVLVTELKTPLQPSQQSAIMGAQQKLEYLTLIKDKSNDTVPPNKATIEPTLNAGKLP